MKHLRIVADVDSDRAPVFFNRLANAPRVEEARVLDWNTLPEEAETVLFSIDGDPSPVQDVAETPSVESIELSETRAGRTYALAIVRPLMTPMFETIRGARDRLGVVVRKPIVYREGRMEFRVVGDPEPLQAALDEAPPGFEVTIERIGPFRPDVDDPTATLSDRQREAVEVALQLGYYQEPRGATLADVGQVMECAPATASSHLRAAERKLIRGMMDSVGTFRGAGS